MSHAPVQLMVRGRGVRAFAADEPLLVSTGGIEPPRDMPATQIHAGDFVGIRYGWEWPTEPASIAVLPPRPRYGNEKAIRVPKRMTTELAFLLGAYLSEGHTTRSNWSVILTNSVMAVLERAKAAWRSEFGLEARITRQPGRCTGLVVSSKRLVEFLELLGCGSRAANKRVPEVILNSTRPHVLAFLQGAALDAYTTCVSSPKWAICLESAEAITGLQDLVTRLEIPNAQIAKFNRQVQKTYMELYAPGRAGQKLCAEVKFLEPDKDRRAMELQRLPIGPHNWADIVPGIKGPELYSLVPAGKVGRSGRGTGRQALRHLCDPRTRHVSRASVMRALEAGAVLPEWLATIASTQVRFSPVTAINAQTLGRSSERDPMN